MSITTFRMKLGDWISGGRWSAWNETLVRRCEASDSNFTVLQSRAVKMERALNESKKKISGNLKYQDSLIERAVNMRIALGNIHRIETPKASHGVKKAARIAREAMDADAESAAAARIKSRDSDV